MEFVGIWDDISSYVAVYFCFSCDCALLCSAPLTVYHLLMRSDTYVNTGNQLSQPKIGTSFLLIFKSRSGVHYTP